MRVLGVDPGNAVTGFGIVDRSGALTCIAAGTIRGGALRGPARLAAIYQGLLAVIDAHAPDAISLERSFAALNIQSAFRLGEARAVVMLAAAHRNLDLFEYAPNEVKLTIAGYGHADKQQVKTMVQRTIGPSVPDDLPEDAADALAISLCHLFRAKMPTQVPPRPHRVTPRTLPLSRSAAPLAITRVKP